MASYEYEGSLVVQYMYYVPAGNGIYPCKGKGRFILQAFPCNLLCSACAVCSIPCIYFHKKDDSAEIRALRCFNNGIYTAFNDEAENWQSGTQISGQAYF